MLKQTVSRLVDFLWIEKHPWKVPHWMIFWSRRQISENAIRDESKQLFEYYRKTIFLQLLKTWDEKFGFHNVFDRPQKLFFVLFKTTVEDWNSELKAVGNFSPHCLTLYGRLFVQKLKSCIKNHYIGKMVNHFAKSFCRVREQPMRPPGAVSWQNWSRL